MSVDVAKDFKVDMDGKPIDAYDTPDKSYSFDFDDDKPDL